LSRLHEKKGLELLMQAFAQIEADTKLWIAGDGESAYRQQLGSHAEQLGISDRCCFIGHVDGEFKNALLQHADLFALTSYSENFGIAVLEAMSAGLAPLVTRGVALSEVLEQEELGLICEPDKAEIKEELMYAVENKHSIAKLGQLAANYTQANYSWETVAEQLRQLYISVAVG